MQNVKKSLIIFDLDGTLIDSVPDLTLAINMTLGKIKGVPVSESLVRSWVGNGSVKLVERALRHQLLPCDESHLHIAHELFLNSYAHNACHLTQAYDGVNDGINRLLAKGLTLAICTNKPQMFLPEIMANMAWTDKFSCVIGGDALPTKKPDPLPLHYICQKIGVTPSQSIMVGDSKNDVQAGQSAGITTLALTYGYNYGEPIADSRPDAVFDEFGAMVDFILKDYC